MGLFHKLAELKNWVLAWASSPFAPMALFLNAWAEAILFPVPPDLLLIAMCLGSAAAGKASLGFLWALVCTVGSVTGGVTGYYIGLKGGRPIAIKMYKEDKVRVADKLYEKYGVWAVAIAGFTPVPYCVFTVLSGALRMRLWSFTVVSIFSRAARFFLVATLIYFFGGKVADFLKDEKRFGLLTIAFFILLIGSYLLLHWFAQHHAKKMKEKEGAGDSGAGSK
jgi:membrane protein YqaA with SNARE-associated domain